MTNNANIAWNLENFLDSLVVELDKARETLALKAINQPLTYAVKDIALELQLFPEYNGEEVRFLTAKPGQTGSSKVSIQLGSITDRQIRETSKKPATRDDITLDVVEEIDEDTKRSLRKIGVTTIKDFEKMEEKNVDLEKAGNNKKFNYSRLANLLQGARRKKQPPGIERISLSKSKENKALLHLQGKNLAISQSFSPVARLNKHDARVVFADDSKLVIELSDYKNLDRQNELYVALDPQSIFKLIINT